MKKGKKSRKRKRGPVLRTRIQDYELQVQKLEHKRCRLMALKAETRACSESVLERYSLSMEEQEELEREWKLGLELNVDYEEAPPEAYLDLYIHTYKSEPLTDLIDWNYSETAQRASFDLANALGLALITIDKAGNINGEIVEY